MSCSNLKWICVDKLVGTGVFDHSTYKAECSLTGEEVDSWFCEHGKCIVRLKELEDNA